MLERVEKGDEILYNCKTAGAGSIPKDKFVEFGVAMYRKESCCFSALGESRRCSVCTYEKKVPATRNLYLSQDLL